MCANRLRRVLFQSIDWQSVGPFRSAGTLILGVYSMGYMDEFQSSQMTTAFLLEPREVKEFLSLWFRSRFSPHRDGPNEALLALSCGRTEIDWLADDLVRRVFSVFNMLT